MALSEALKPPLSRRRYTTPLGPLCTRQTGKGWCKALFSLPAPVTDNLLLRAASLHPRRGGTPPFPSLPSPSPPAPRADSGLITRLRLAATGCYTGAVETREEAKVDNENEDEGGSARREGDTYARESGMSLRLNAIIIKDNGVSAREFPSTRVPSQLAPLYRVPVVS